MSILEDVPDASSRAVKILHPTDETFKYTGMRAEREKIALSSLSHILKLQEVSISFAEAALLGKTSFAPRALEYSRDKSRETSVDKATKIGERRFRALISAMCDGDRDSPFFIMSAKLSGLVLLLRVGIDGIISSHIEYKNSFFLFFKYTS